MRPITLTLEGFQGYRDSQQVDLGGVERAAITGRVGAGKSSLLDGINFALFGKVRVPTKDGVINSASDKAVCEVEFTERDALYKVSRTLTRSGNSKAYLWRWDEEVCDWLTEGDQDGRVGVTDTAVRNVVGLSWEAYRASVIVEQGKSSGFADASPSERYSLLSQIVGLDKYSRWTDAASEDRKAVRVALSQTQARIDEQTTLLSDADLVKEQAARLATQRTTLAEALTQAEARVELVTKDEQVARAHLDLAQQQAHIATARQAADRTVTQAQQHLDEAAATVQRLTRAAATLDDAKREVATATDSREQAEQRLTEVIKEGEAARAALDRARTARVSAQEQIVTINERLAGLTKAHSSTCFTCAQDLPSERRDAVVENLHAERAGIEAQVRQFDEQIATANSERERAVAEHSRWTTEGRAAQARIDRASRPMQDAQRAAEDLPGAASKQEAAAETLEFAVAARSSLDETRTINVADAEATWQRASRAVENARQNVAQAKETIADARSTEAVLADRIERHDAARQAIKALNAKVETLREDEEGWSLLIEAFSPSGVPRMIMDTAIEEINIDLDADLTALSGGALTATLDTMRATKAGSMKSEITMTVIGQDGARVYESYSGGQRYLVDLAFHLALSKTLARRNGSSIDFIAVDEGWGSLEGEEREAVLRALHELAADNEALLLAITHVEEVANSFPTRIETEMVSGTSVTTIH